ncbi:MAG: hypothetical protein V3W19_16305 [Desulfatiglandales bacterium]
MGKIIKDIKVVGAKDKLIILLEGKTPENLCIQMTNTVKKFMKNKDRFLFIRGLQVFILKDGAEISVVQALNNEIKIKKGG